MSNQTDLRRLINDCTPYELAVLRERILTIMEYTMANLDSHYDKNVINPTIIEALYEKVHKHLEIK